MIFFELLSVILFFLAYNYYGILLATKVLIIMSVASYLYAKFVIKSVSRTQLLSTFIICIFGGLTLYSSDPQFIKMKPTVIYMLFAFSLLVALWFDRLLIYDALHNVMPLSRQNRMWYTMTYMWIGIFILMACLNEYVWRNYSENTWVNFKIFGCFALMSCAAIIQSILFHIGRHNESREY